MSRITIGRAAHEAGVGVETIRFYERKGLIAQPRKPKNSGFRDYPRETVQRIHFIKQAQEIGFSLRVIRPMTLETPARKDRSNLAAEIDCRSRRFRSMNGQGGYKLR